MNRTAVVTGAGSGIGRALALELSRRGANLAISDVDRDGLDETLRRCESGPGAGKVLAYRVDVADRTAVLAHADEVVETFGTVNLVINNAGVAVAATVEEMSFEDLDWLLGINLFGVINGTKAFLPHLIASGDGHIANLSSVFGLIAPPTQSAYSAAKFAVRGFTESLRMEMIAARHPVTVHSVHPGGIRTNIARNARVSGTVAAAEDDPAGAFEKVARTSPDKAARTILAGIDRDTARILVGPDAWAIAGLARTAGARYLGPMGRLARRGLER